MNGKAWIKNKIIYVAFLDSSYFAANYLDMIKRQIIGAIDKIDFPEFELFDLGCRIDTGATSSAIHCQNIIVVQANGIETISFELLDAKHPSYNKQTYCTKDFTRKKVRSSFGQEEVRYAITTDVVLFNTTYTTQFTLADRVKMRYPVLIGRNLLRQGFVVDVRKKNTSFKHKSHL